MSLILFMGWDQFLTAAEPIFIFTKYIFREAHEDAFELLWLNGSHTHNTDHDTSCLSLTANDLHIVNIELERCFLRYAPLESNISWRGVSVGGCEAKRGTCKIMLTSSIPHAFHLHPHYW